MDTWLIVVLAVAALIVVAIVATGPMMRKKGSSAARRAKEELGGEVEILEPKAVGFATRPPEAGGLRGMGVLAASSSKVVFVTWAPQAVFAIDRALLTSVSSPVENVDEAHKAMIEFAFTVDGDEVVAPFRVPEPNEWLSTFVNGSSSPG